MISNSILPFTHIPDPDAEPYIPDPRPAWRVELAFRVDFTNGGMSKDRIFCSTYRDRNSPPNERLRFWCRP